ncbi:MAG: Protein translocase subunit SecA [Calditrichaeota bacterium]|nr:Protein translocase subunit SecA [Calditrichota bacterium]
MNVLTQFFGTRHERERRKIQPLVDEINEHYERLLELSDEELRAKTGEFREFIRERMEGFDRYAGIEKADPEREKKAKKAELDELNVHLEEILPEAFAVVKEACRRLKEREHTFVAADTEMTWDMVPFDVQLIGAVMLHRGRIAEMATGEGKTLVATMPLYLNALAGRGAHLITVNDYLARRDAEWMGQVYQFLGLTTGVILGQMSPEVRKEHYAADITYGTNNEFGFDYLRDNMAVAQEQIVQRGHHYAIVDEVDSVLIDEARTPLIIAGPVPRSSEGDFERLNPSVKTLVGRQRRLIVRLLDDAESLLNGKADLSGEQASFKAGILINQAKRGAPRHKRVLKLLSEQGIKTLVQQVEDEFIRDKRPHELDEGLFYTIDEKTNTIDLTDMGRDELAKIEHVEPDFYMLPDLTDVFHEVESDTTLSDREKAEKKALAEAQMAERSSMLHTITQLLRAHTLYNKDDEYVIENGKVQIVDTFTGRIMYGRRYSDGLHQAIEAKEGVRVEAETQTIATITLQNYFRLYGKLAGMTGTAETEEEEFFKIYRMDVSVIPTNQPVARLDEEDEVYRTQREKYSAIIDEIVRLHELGLPILVGTTSVEVSELIARMLGAQTVGGRKLKDYVNVLNAKQHQREAEIVQHAGRPGAITIATNMAGRGTDIKIAPAVRDAHGERGVITQRLEADPELRERHKQEYGVDPGEQVGGLQIVGTERHEARRIDRQLRGRSGRQGDPGRSRFYVSLEDDLMRMFGGERIGKIMDSLGIEEGEVITHSMVTRAIEKAQKRVEQYNFSIREHLLKYDDVMNIQREVIYARRRSALHGDIHEELANLLEEYIAITIDRFTSPREGPFAWELDELRSALLRTLHVDAQIDDDEMDTLTADELESRVLEEARQRFISRREYLGDELYERLLRYTILRVVDQQWMEHLYEMDRLKEGIGLRSYAQKDPLIEYKREGLAAFEEMLGRIAETSLRMVLTAEVRVEEPERPAVLDAGRQIKSETAGMGLGGREEAPQPAMAGATVERAMSRPSRGSGAQPQRQAARQQTVTRDRPKIGRNDPCWCGSGKKFKHCHGRST